MKSANKIRVQIDLAPQSFERLKRLKNVTEASSYTDVLKDALRLYEFIVETDQNGSRLVLIDQVGRQSDLKVFA